MGYYNFTMTVLLHRTVRRDALQSSTSKRLRLFVLFQINQIEYANYVSLDACALLLCSKCIKTLSSITGGSSPYLLNSIAHHHTATRRPRNQRPLMSSRICVATNTHVQIHRQTKWKPLHHHDKPLGALHRG